MERSAFGLVVLLASAPLAGCWVADEIDRGSQWIDDHSPRIQEQKREQAKKAADAKANKLDEYIQTQDANGGARTFTPGQVSEGIVACKLAGETQFMTKENCAARGGRS